MKKIRFYMAFLLFFAVSYGLLAQRSSSDAIKILNKVYESYEKSSGIKVSFIMKNVESNGYADEAQRGTALVKNNKFHVSLPTMNVWFDGSTQWVWIRDVNEVSISNPSKDEIATISPLALISMYKDGYVLDAPLSKQINGKNTYQIGLNPTDIKTEFKKIWVAIDKKDNSLVQVTFTLKNGVKTTIDIQKYESQLHFSDADFLFNSAQYPDVEIVDLR